jgi:hypothetical protein
MADMKRVDASEGRALLAQWLNPPADHAPQGGTATAEWNPESRKVLDDWLRNNAESLLAELAELRPRAAALAEGAEIVGELETLNARLSDLLNRTANALKGEPRPGSLHSWHDLPEVAALMRAVRQAEDAVVEAAMAMNDEVGHRGAWLSVPCLRAVCDAVDALRAARTGGRDA